MPAVQTPLNPPTDTAFATLLADAVRDLDWLLHSPDLLAPSADFPLAAWPAGVAAPDLAASAFRQDLAALLHAQPPRRLGRYAETLLTVALQHSVGLRLLGHNLPVRQTAAKEAPQGAPRGTQTLGEFDFLWQDCATRSLHHWELATKFYLYVPLPAGDTTHWANQLVGPNLADRLGDKLRKVQSQQLSLAHTPAGRMALAACLAGQQGIEVDVQGEANAADWHAALYLKGWIFLPNSPFQQGAGADARAVPAFIPPSALNPQGGQGWWCDFDSFSQVAAHLPNDERWLCLPKARWLAPVVTSAAAMQTAEANGQALAPQHLAAEPNNAWLGDLHRQVSQVREVPVQHLRPNAPARSRQRPPEPVMVVCLKQMEAGGWREQSRGFVVPNGWREVAQVFAREK